jgi:hypothetical protein
MVFARRSAQLSIAGVLLMMRERLLVDALKVICYKNAFAPCT